MFRGTRCAPSVRQRERARAPCAVGADDRRECPVLGVGTVAPRRSVVVVADGEIQLIVGLAVEAYHLGLDIFDVSSALAAEAVYPAVAVEVGLFDVVGVLLAEHLVVVSLDVRNGVDALLRNEVVLPAVIALDVLRYIV